MITLFAVLSTLLVVAVWKVGPKIVKRFLNKTVTDVKEALSISPIDSLRSQLKKQKLAVAELKANTLTLEAERDKQLGRKDNAMVIAEAAKTAENKEDAKEAFLLAQDAETNVNTIIADIEANEKLYDSITKSISTKQVQVNKYESQKTRSDARRANNEIRKNLAKDALLGEGVFTNLEVDEICSEEIDAIAIEQTKKDIDGDSDLFEKYKDNSNDEFEEFFSAK